VTNAVLEFFITGRMIKHIGHTNLVRIPKVDGPKEARDFRLFACC